MHRSFQMALFFSVLSSVTAVSAAAPLSPAVPADSFIFRHVSSVPELKQQISLDPVVRRRLAVHFHVSAPAVTHYVQDNLVLRPLKTAQTFKVYCVSRSGREYTVSSRLAAGTPVFVLRSTGQPILKLACGNPMVSSLPPVTPKIRHLVVPETEIARRPSVVPAPLLHHSVKPIVVAMAKAPALGVLPTTRVSGYLGSLPAVHGGHFPLGYLAGIPLLAVLPQHHGGTSGTSTTAGAGTTGTGFIGGTGTNGNNSGVSGTTGNTGNTGNSGFGTGTGTTSVTPVPEPSTTTAFAVGGVGLLFLLATSRRRSRTKERQS